MFTREGIFNFHNVHIRAHINPHAIREARHQTTFSINVWSGIVGDRLTGQVRLPERLTGPTYREFLERLTRDILPDVLDDVPLQLPVGMWFMHDGAPPHFSRIARQCLNDHFPGKWIWRNVPVAWPLVPRISIISISTFGATLKMKFTAHPLLALTSYGNAS